MTVIAMTREMGTLGKDVAAGVAHELGIEVIHHELVERNLAERLQTSESAVHRFLEGEASLWERWSIDSKRLSRFTAEEILQLAEQGNVLIRGWGAAQLLRDVAHVICVRVCAPMPERIVEMKKRLGAENDAVARREIERNDDAHARAVQRQFNVDWRDPTGYDLTINTAHLPVETGVSLLHHLAQSPCYQPTESSRRELADKLLEARIRTIVDNELPDSPVGSSLDVVVHDGVVTLSGVVAGDGRLRDPIAAIEAMDGVKSVTADTVRVPLTYGP